MARRLSSLWVLASACVGLLVASVSYSQTGQAAYRPGEVIIKFKSATSQAQRQAILDDLGAISVKSLDPTRAQHATISSLSVDQAIARYRTNPSIAYIEPNYVYRIDATPNDPRFTDLWGMNNTGQTGGTAGADISAVSAWDMSTGSSDVLVAIIDTGADYTHPDLAANIFVNPGEIPGNSIDDDGNGFIDDVRGWDFANNDNDPMDDHGHGTHVSGTVGAVGNNGIGVVGVNWHVKLLPIKFLDAGGSGSTTAAVNAINYAIRMHVRVMSNSWGGTGFSQALQEAVQAASDSGIAFVAAAGNDGANNDIFPHYPANYPAPTVISVAATDHNDQLADFSDYGPTTVDLAAPGVSILSTFPGANYGSLSGTSMATPHVSGAIALILARFPDMNGLSAKNLLLSRVDPLSSLAGRVLTGGRLNAFMPIAEPDSTPPALIADLAVIDVNATRVTLRWTATGDDGASGTASRYDVRYSTAPINEANFPFASPAGNLPNPLPAGGTEQLEIHGLTFSTSYYFAVKALDEFDNGSPISNVASATTLGPPDITVSPSSFSQALLTGGVATQVLTVGNNGAGELIFDVSVRDSGGAASTNRPDAEPIERSQPPAWRTFTLGNRGPGQVMPPGAPPSATPYGLGGSALRPKLSPGDIEIQNALTASNMRILLLQSGGDVTEIRALLASFPDVGAVDVFDALFTTPTLNQLLDYDAVIVIADRQTGDPNGVGNVLADYADAGGGVVLTLATFISGFEVRGRLLSGGYFPFELGSGPAGSSTLGSFNAGHPIMSGVSSAFGDLLGNVVLTGQAESVASWIDGRPFVATVGSNIAAVNIFVGATGFWTGDIPLILHNAASWSSGIARWLSTESAHGVVPAGGALGVVMRFDAHGLAGGGYDANIQIESDDPDESQVTVPAHLTVTAAPDIALSEAILDYGSVFIVASPRDTVEVSNVGTLPLHVTQVSVNHADFSVASAAFTLAVGERRQVVVTFHPSTAAPIQGTLTLLSDDPDQPTATVALRGVGLVPPDIAVSPSSFDEALFTGQTRSRTLTISNTGGSDLPFRLAVRTTSQPSAARATDAEAGSAPRWVQPRTPLAPEETAGHPTATIRTMLPAGTPFTFRDDFEDGNFDGWLMGALGPKEVTNATAANGTHFSFHEFNSPGGHLTGVYQEFPGVQPGYAGFYVRPGSTTSNTGYFVLWNANLYDAIWFFARETGRFYVNGDVGGDESVPYVANQWYHVEFKNIDFTAKSFDYYVDGSLIKENISFRNAGSVQEFSRLDLYNFTGGAQAWWDEIHVSDAPPVSWLGVEPTIGVVPAGNSLQVTVSFDAAGLIGGLYGADIVVTSNDPDEGEVTVPAALHVTGAPDVTLSDLAFDFGSVFIGGSATDSLLISNVGTDVLNVSGITLSNPNFVVPTNPFSLAVGASRSIPVRFQPSSAAPISGTLTMHTNDPDEAVLTVSLSGVGVVPPDIAVSPDSISDALLTGQTSNHTLTISNTGPTPLVFRIFSAPRDLSAGAFGAPRTEGGSNETLLQGQEGARGQPAFDHVPQYDAYRQKPDTQPSPVEPAAEPGLLGFYANLTSVLSDSFVVFHDDMEHGPNGWTHYSTHANNFDFWGQSVVRSSSGSISWNVAQHPYEGSEALQSPVIDLANVADATLTFKQWYNFDDCNDPSFEPDGGIVEVSANGGVTWEQVNPIAGYPYVLDDICFNPLAHRPAYSHDGGNGSLFVPAVFDLSPYVGGNIKIRFHSGWDCGNCALNEGWYIDDVTVYAQGVGWLSTNPSSGTVPPNANLNVAVTFDAAGLFGGDYDSHLLINSNDPDESEVRVPAHLHVTGAPDIALSASTLDFGSVFVGGARTEVLAISNVGTDLLTVSEIIVNHGDFSTQLSGFSLPPGGRDSLFVTFRPSTPNPISATLRILSNDPDEAASVVGLQGTGLVAPVIATTPTAIATTLFTGQSQTQPLLIRNLGGNDLTFHVEASGAESLQVYAAVQYPKGAPDPRVGHPVVEGSGGPDLFGYHWSDSDEPGGPTFNWVEISAIGTVIQMTGDDANAGPFPIGFQFPFYGVPFTNFRACTNGWVSFTSESFAYTNQPLPSPGAPENLLAAFWDDLIFTVNRAYYYNDGNRLIIEYKNVPNLVAGGPYTFEIILYPNGRIVYQYLSITGPSNSGTVGIQNGNQDDGLTVAFNTNYVHDGLAVQFTAAAKWLTVSPTSGTVPPGGALPINVTTNALELFGGPYESEVALRSNDPLTPRLAVPVTLAVINAPDIAVGGDPLTLESSIDYGTFGAQTLHDLAVSVPPVGAGTLTLIAEGNFDQPFRTATAVAEGTQLGRVGGFGAFCSAPTGSFPLSATEMTRLVADGHVAVTVANTFDVSPFCPVNRHTVRLQYSGLVDVLDFGDLFVGLERNLGIVIQNRGTNPLHVNSIQSDVAAFAPSTAALTLAPRASQALTVRFRPLAGGTFAGTLRIQSDDPDEQVVTIPLRGIGVIPPDISVSPDSMSANLFTGQSATRTLSIENNGGSDLVWSIGVRDRVIAVVSASVDSRAPRAPSLAQEGHGVAEHDVASSHAPLGYHAQASVDSAGVNAEVAIIQDALPWNSAANQEILSASGISYDLIGSAQVAATDLSRYRLVIVPSDQPTFFYTTLASRRSQIDTYVSQGGVLEFHAAGWGWSSGDASQVTLPGGMSINQYYSSRNDVIDPAHPLVVGVPNPFFGSSASHSYFTNIPQGTSEIATDEFGRTNLVVYRFGSGTVVTGCQTFEYGYGNAEAAGTILRNMIPYAHALGSSWLAVDPREGILPAGHRLDLTVTFDAAGLNGGDYDAHIVIGSNDPDESEVLVPAHLHVTGAPVLVVSPEALDFGALYLGASRSESLTVSNGGTDLLSVHRLSVNRADFGVASTGFDLQPGEHRDVEVVFHPVTEGAMTGILTLESNDPVHPELRVSLDGVGVPPPDIDVTPAAIALSVAPNHTAHRAMTVRNLGRSPLTWDIRAVAGGNTQVLSTSPVLGSTQATVADKSVVEKAPGAPAAGGVYVASTEGGLRPEASGAPAVATSDPPLEDVRSLLDAGYSSVNGAIPNRFDFSEGEVGYYIVDGGNDMYDGGNYLFATFGGPLAYSDSSITESPYLGAGGRYFTRKYPGLFVLAADIRGIFDFATQGDLGADGSGNVDGAVLERVVSGRTYRGFVKRVYSASDPSVNHLVIVENSPNANHEFATFTNDDYHRVLGLTSTTRIYYLLYAGANGSYINNAAAAGIMDAFINAVNPWPQWLRVDPTAGTTPGLGSAGVVLTFDATGLGTGDYSSRLIVSSNDPGTPTLEVPINLHVAIPVVATVDVDPSTLNGGSNGNWVTVYVELPPPTLPGSVLIPTVRLNDQVAADPGHVSIGDNDHNGIPDLTLKFPRGEVASILPGGDQVEVIVTGDLADGRNFSGNDFIRVKKPQTSAPNGGEIVVGGTHFNVTWIVPVEWQPDHADLDLSLDGGVTWTPIVSNVHGQSYVWSVPLVSTPSAVLRVSVYDLGGLLGADVSDGVFRINLPPTEAGESAGPGVYALRQNSPNPFRGWTSIGFDLSKESDVRVTVFDMAGRLVKVLAAGRLPAGRHETGWDGRDATGSAAAAGVYFYRIDAPGYGATKRMVLID